LGETRVDDGLEVEPHPPTRCPNGHALDPN
jgi:hypothetical protein